MPCFAGWLEVHGIAIPKPPEIASVRQWPAPCLPPNREERARRRSCALAKSFREEEKTSTLDVLGKRERGIRGLSRRHPELDRDQTKPSRGAKESRSADPHPFAAAECSSQNTAS